MVQKQITTLLSKEMDRKDFLKHVGIAVIAVTGVSGVISSLTKLDVPSKKTAGYGGSAYGK
jgi:hypothetical protein